MSPSFIGTEPSVFTLAGQDYEVVRDKHLAGYGLFQALNQDQQLKADEVNIPKDIVAGPGNDGVRPGKIGLSAADMTADQRRLLLHVIRLWVAVQPDEDADTRMQELEENLDHISFAWRGDETVNTPTYMRVQGPTLIIELLSTGGNIGESAIGAGHYHTIYRNPVKEYGMRN